MRRIFKRLLQAQHGKISSVRAILGAFCLIILLGTVLLMLPVSSKTSEFTDFITALFTATSATCVTGLSLVETGLYWSGFGQVVLLCLIQIGGLGFMTIVAAFFYLSGRKLGLRERLVIAQAYSLNDLRDVAVFLKKAALWTFLFEAFGALALTIRFSHDMPFGKALWCGVFHAVSAFCNAGFDVLGAVETGGSLTPYVCDAWVNVVIMLLITCGGLGFFVWNDIFRRKCFRKLSVYSKLAILTNATLVLVGFVLFAALEWNNQDTIGGFDPFHKLLAALFQSVTTRTAGFATIAQGSMTEASLALTDILMLIGGGSGSTAGGMKTVTFCIMILSVFYTLFGKEHVTVFKKNIAHEQIRQASSIVGSMVILTFVGALLLSLINNLGYGACLYETSSALGTVGLSTGITGELNTVSRLLLVVYMFFGRVGVMTVGLAFLYGNGAKQRYQYAEEKMMIG